MYTITNSHGKGISGLGLDSTGGSEAEPIRDIVAQVQTQLERRFRDPNDPGLYERRKELRRLFSLISGANAEHLHTRLESSRDPLGQLFRYKLATATRKELLAILRSRMPSSSGKPDSEAVTGSRPTRNGTSPTTAPQPKITPSHTGVTVSTSCDTKALQAIPSALRPKLLGCLRAAVPSRNVRWLLENSLNEKEPNWVKRLTTDITQVIPNVEVTVELFRFIPLRPYDPSVTNALNAYLKAKGNPYYSGIVAELSLRRDLEDRLNLKFAELFDKVGLPVMKKKDETYWSHMLVVSANFPQAVEKYVNIIRNANLDRFEFDRWNLPPQHVPTIKAIAQQIVESWQSQRMVTRIILMGHTDERGTRKYNEELGRKRAAEVEKYLKGAVDDLAPFYMKGSLKSIKYELISLGKDAPISRNHALNRRVEVSLYYREPTGPTGPVSLEKVVQGAIELLQRPNRLGQEKVNRLLCVLNRLQMSQVKDEYVNSQEVFLIGRDNRFPSPTDWHRLRFDLTNVNFFGPQISADQVLTNLERLDSDIIEGVLKINQIINIQGGATPVAIEQLRNWVEQRIKDDLSIYRCYQKVFRG